jgi:glycosyltransferase involved in cell wall biosynthesis
MTLRVAVVCPFNLDRLTGTPIRGRTLSEAVAEACDLGILATGGSLPDLRALQGSWRTREGRPAKFRLGSFTRRAFRGLTDFAPEVIHAMTTAAVLPAWLYKVSHRRVRLVYEVHGLTAYEMCDASWRARWVFALLDWIGIKWADAIIAVSHTQRNVLCRRWKVPAEKVQVVWGPVDLDLFAYRPPPPPTPFCVGYLGNAMYWQGVETILEAARMLVHDRALRFLLGGFDAALYRDKHPENIEFAGMVTRREVAPFLARCHALLSPRIGGTVTDTQYPQKLSEYLAVGRPIIASDVNDQPRIVQEADCGLIVPAGDGEALAKAVKQMRDLPGEKRLAMAVNARRFAEQHLSKKAIGQCLLAIYAG